MRQELWDIIFLSEVCMYVRYDKCFFQLINMSSEIDIKLTETDIKIQEKQ